MVEKEKFLVVISVLEGRRFPKRPKHKVIAEARFDGELLASDPVDHVEAPDFTQELAWELDKKGLQQHRLQRTSIKIQCYAVDSVSTMKEVIGYVVLDIRSVQTKQTAKWYPLLHSKYSKNKPEIKLSIYLDDDKTGEQPSFKAREAPPRVIEDLAEGEGYLRTLQPVLVEDEGYYQIGPADKCKDSFVMSVTIGYANNLAQLIPSTHPLPSVATGYFFYFSLLGNDVTNETFQDLINPNFPAERASVKIKSSVDALRIFLSSQPGVQVHLCCGDQSLGNCEIPLNTLIKKNSTEIHMKPVTIEGPFQLNPPNKAKQQMLSAPPDLAPVVGVSIVLRKEDMGVMSPGKGPSGENIHEIPKSPVRSPTHSPVRSPPKTPKKDGHKSPKKGKGKGKSKGKQEETAEKEVHYPDDFEVGNNTQENVSSLEEDKMKEREQEYSNQTTSTHVAIPPQAHHFTFSIDLRSIKDVDSSNTLFVYLKYMYPFFGSASAIITHPPVEIRRGMEVLLPQSFCAFDFACSTQQLQETFLRVPLMVEVFHRDKQQSRDVLVGVTKLPLEQIISTDKNRISSNAGGSGWRQSFSDRINVVSPESEKKVGDICMVLSLEDWGPISAHQIVVQQETTNAPSHQQVQQTQPPRAPSPVEPRETPEYQAAIELELWKETQEKTFENQLKQKEASYMKALAEEWKKRDRERELLMKKKLAEYANLEEQLRKTLKDLEKREKQLAANEQEVMRLKKDLQREHDAKLQEMKEASRRMKDDVDHKIELEKSKTKEIENLVERYKRELNEAEMKYHKLEKDFAVYKEQQNTKPEVRLQAEINLLTLEKVELERKLDTVNKSKVHYKQQWGRALKELARLKQKEQTAAKAELKRQQQELEHMRLRYLAAEEKEVVKSDKKELEEIKNELNRLKLLEEEKLKNSFENSPREVDGMRPLKPDLDCSIDEHITRLIEERDTLLRTGVYSTQDRIIAELDRQIRDSMVQKKTNNL
ncbi:centrosomal protein of 120 kDa-like isoform X2 [Mytilus galloprovincialis]|uniref:centrosomal protein of 120 kDa-like isoform X2 n=1 Tax=Mytilus galloprovincialis TaxID=29158 RepID=UPI003F7B6E57